MKLDKEGASRFIRAAISNQPKGPSSDSSFYNSKATVEDPLDGPGRHTRLVSLAKSSERRPSSMSDGSSEDEDLQVFTGADEGSTAVQTSATSNKGKKRKWATEDVSETHALQAASEASKVKTDPLQGVSSVMPNRKAMLTLMVLRL
jgi:hypothetical protein